MGMSEGRAKRLNKIAHENAIEREQELVRLGTRYRNGDTGKYVYSLIKNAGVSPAQIEETTQFIIRMFKSRGFDEIEALKYISKYKRILNLKEGSIVSRLAILDIAHLSDEAFFEDPSILINSYPLDRIYDGLKAIRESEEEVTLTGIRKVARDEDRKVEYRLTKERLSSFYRIYMINLAKKEAELEKANAEAQELKKL